MNQEDTLKLIIATVDAKIKEMDLGFRRWNPIDSVTDQFSPITGASQQIGFFGTNKVAQPTTSIAGATFVDSGATTIHTASTFDGYTVGQAVKALRTLGILK